MSLSKQLYIIITFIFFIIFTGNFIISIKNTKEYLEVESQTKAQDTATSLGMSLRPLIKDKKDPEIESIIKAISNSGFYKEIRLEDSDYIINDYELLNTISRKDKNVNWKIKEISVEQKYGYIERIQSDYELSEQLLKLENDSFDSDSFDSFNEDSFVRYRYIPTEAYINGGKIPFNLNITNGKEDKDIISTIDIKKVLLQEKRDIKFESVPSWFIELIPLELEEKFSEISDGWKKSAVIFVSPNPGEAYAKLYEQAKNSIVYAIIAFIISIIILFIFVQYLLKPLKRIESLAKSIALGKFETIDELPWTTEIKHVSIAMNDMSRKIEAIINKLNRNLQILSEKLSRDDLTKLPLKSTFETDMKQMFIRKSKGYILKIKINTLSHFAKVHTDKEVNNFIIEFTDEIKNILKKEDDNKLKLYRFFGSEFMLIFEDCDYSCTEKICKKLKNSFYLLSEKYQINELAHIGATPFNNYSTTPEMLQATNESYEKAKLIGPNDYFIRDTNDLIRDMEEWRDLIFNIIENNSFEIEYINDTYSSKDEEILLMQEAFTSARDKNNKNIPIGTFVSIAEKYEKIVDFDMAVISKVMNYMIINNIKHDIMINLSLNSIENEEFIFWLENKILSNRKIASQLLFSVTAYAVIKNIKGFKNFCDRIHKVGAKIIVKRFESKFIPLDNLKDFNLDFMRLARDYTTDIYLDTSKQSFVESVKELANLLNIKVYCENINNNKDYDMIKKIKIDGVSR